MTPHDKYIVRCAKPSAAQRRLQSGFSLIELMAGLAVGLLAMLAVFQVFNFATSQSRTSAAAADAQQAGALSLYLLEREVRMSGYGFNLEEGLGCNVRAQNTSGNYQFTLSPVVIQQGVGGGSDTVTVIRGSGDRPVWSPLSLAYAGDATPLTVAGSFAFRPNDFALIVSPTLDCTLMQITAVNANNLTHAANGFNPGSGAGVQYTDTPGVGIQASVVSLGAAPAISQYSVVAGKLMVADVLNGAPATLYADNVLAIKAQYGFNTPCPAANASSDRVGSYSGAMIDADGDGTVGNRGDWARIKALRVAVVARGTQYEKNVVSPPTLKLWPDSASPATVGPTISLTAEQQHYRYNVFTTIVPIRNMLWSRGLQWGAAPKCPN